MANYSKEQTAANATELMKPIFDYDMTDEMRQEMMKQIENRESDWPLDDEGPIEGD